MFVMFDTVNVTAVPSFANTDRDAVAGYIDGRFNDFHQLAATFPHAHHLDIAVRASDDATCLDIEAGDARPDQFPDWFLRQSKRGVWRPVGYCNLSTLPELLAAIHRAGIHRELVRLWVAHFTGTPHLEPGSDATQWTDHALGRNLDESLCLDTFFPAARPAAPAPRHATARIYFDETSRQWAVTPEPENAPVVTH